MLFYLFVSKDFHNNAFLVELIFFLQIEHSICKDNTSCNKLKIYTFVYRVYDQL